MNLLQQQNLAQFQGSMAEQGQNSSNILTAQGIDRGVATQQAQQNTQMGVGAMAALSALFGTGGTASDIHSKKNIKSGKQQLSNMLEDMYNSNKFKKLLIVI